MPWTCPNGCHIQTEDWCVERWINPGELIVQYYAETDKEMATEIRAAKVYPGQDVVHNIPHCVECDAGCEWKEAADADGLD